MAQANPIRIRNCVPIRERKRSSDGTNQNRPVRCQVTEVGYNALHNRLGTAMPNAQKYTEAHRPSGTDNYFNAWTTLTHADNPSLPPPVAGPSTGFFIAKQDDPPYDGATGAHTHTDWRRQEGAARPGLGDAWHRPQTQRGPSS